MRRMLRKFFARGEQVINSVDSKPVFAGVKYLPAINTESTLSVLFVNKGIQFKNLNMVRELLTQQHSVIFSKYEEAVNLRQEKHFDVTLIGTTIAVNGREIIKNGPLLVSLFSKQGPRFAVVSEYRHQQFMALKELNTHSKAPLLNGQPIMLVDPMQFRQRDFLGELMSM